MEFPYPLVPYENRCAEEQGEPDYASIPPLPPGSIPAGQQKQGLEISEEVQAEMHREKVHVRVDTVERCCCLRSVHRERDLHWAVHSVLVNSLLLSERKRHRVERDGAALWHEQCMGCTQHLREQDKSFSHWLTSWRAEADQ